MMLMQMKQAKKGSRRCWLSLNCATLGKPTFLSEKFSKTNSSRKWVWVHAWKNTMVKFHLQPTQMFHHLVPRELYSMKWSLKEAQHLLELVNILLIFFFSPSKILINGFGSYTNGTRGNNSKSFRILYSLLTRMSLRLYCGKEDKTGCVYGVMGRGVDSLEMHYIPGAKRRRLGQVEPWDQPLPSFKQTSSPLVCFL